MVERVNPDSKFIKPIIAGDQIWKYLFDMQTKLKREKLEILMTTETNFQFIFQIRENSPAGRSSGLAALLHLSGFSKNNFPPV